MVTRPLAALLLGFMMAAAGSGALMAQTKDQFGPRAGKQPQPDAQPAQVVATHGAWKIQCENVNLGDGQGGEQRSCGMVQGTKSDKNPKAILTLVVVRSKVADKVQYNMRVIAPIGVFLPTGVALEIDGNAVGRVPFTRCMPQICMAFAEASPETLDKMKKGSEANFIIYEAPGIGLPMKLSLTGFSAALADLDNY
jgi:invasion protein IalB